MIGSRTLSHYNNNNNKTQRIKHIINKTNKLMNKINKRLIHSNNETNKIKLNKLKNIQKRMKILEHKENNKLDHKQFQKFMKTFKSLQPLLTQSRSYQSRFAKLKKGNKRSVLAQLNPNTNFINNVDLPMLPDIDENNNNITNFTYATL